MNNLFPVFIKLDKIHTLLVGAGYVGTEKLSAMLRNDPQARITVVADMVSAEFERLAGQAEHVRIIRRKFFTTDLTGKDLVIVAVNDRSVGERIRAEARVRRILTNVADTPELCDFYLGSVVRKGDLKLAISTNGKSPTLARRLRAMLEEILPDGLQDVLDNLHAIRSGLRVSFDEKVEILNEITQSFTVKKTG